MNKEHIPDCKYNNGVGCENQIKCHRCGWNPTVYAERVKKIKEARNAK